MRTLGALLLGLLLARSAGATEPAAVDYRTAVRPILDRHCIACHGPDKQRAGLRLDTAEAAIRGGQTGPAVVPGDHAASLLLKAVTGVDEIAPMPPRGPRLSAAEIRVLATWIDQGARAPKEIVAEAKPSSTHWAFQPPTRPTAPSVRNDDWCRTPVDRFVLARLERHGLAPAPEADRATLIRRLSLDLLGLPPTPAEVDAFLTDPAPDAYERLIDRLLASPHYGERQARHWLDVARYADSDGYNLDSPRAIWKYRDGVIDALNANLPFDRFVTEQLAGDLLPGATVAQRIATGFHRNTLRNLEGGVDQEQFRVEAVADRVNTTGAAFLGLTVGCARCHDHKSDPLSQREYYGLFAFFNRQDEPTLDLPTPEQDRQRAELRTQTDRLREALDALTAPHRPGLAAWETRLTDDDRIALPDGVRVSLVVPRADRTPAQRRLVEGAYHSGVDARHAATALAAGGPLLHVALLRPIVTRSTLEQEITTLAQQEPAVVTTLVLAEQSKPRPTHVHINGDFTRPGPRVEPGVPAILPPLAAARPNRLDLARWLIDPRHPLTARVTVNRVWQQYFGLGLVETENDFGTLGAPPSHPDLLDWLATAFIASGWDVKALHRLIVTSATYRQASRVRPELAAVDPRNRLLARQARLRLEAEVVRDVALAASGRLVPRVGGPSVFPPQPAGVAETTAFGSKWTPSTGPDRYRRGMYTHFWRAAPHPTLTAFDAPTANAACTRRGRSNTPLQALLLLNDQAFYEFAQALAARVLRDGPTDDHVRVRFAFRLCLGREPGAGELGRLVGFLAEQTADLTADPAAARALAPADTAAGDAPRAAAWVLLARVLLNLDEFITRE